LHFVCNLQRYKLHGILHLRRVHFHRFRKKYVNDDGTYPASKLKLYIHDVDAALKTLHHIRWYSLFTRNSQAFGLWSESLPGRSSPSSAHFSARNFRLVIKRCSVSAVVICSNIFSSGVWFASCQNVIKPSICKAKSMRKDVVRNRYFYNYTVLLLFVTLKYCFVIALLIRML